MTHSIDLFVNGLHPTVVLTKLNTNKNFAISLTLSNKMHSNHNSFLRYLNDIKLILTSFLQIILAAQLRCEKIFMPKTQINFKLCIYYYWKPFLDFSEVKENHLVHKLHDHTQICW